MANIVTSFCCVVLAAVVVVYAQRRSQQVVTFFASLLQSVCWSGTEKSHCEQRVSIT
ncbi:hypothetical protein PO909_022217 [Leuciscus waleckii]